MSTLSAIRAAIIEPAYRSRIVAAGNFLIGVLAAYFFSRLLQKLSGQALWQPKSWRDAFSVVTTILGPAVFALVSHRRSETPEVPRPAAGSANQAFPIVANAIEPASPLATVSEVHSEKDDSTHHVRAIVWILVCSCLIIGYMGLRALCMRPFPLQEWLRLQEDPDQVKSNPPDFIDVQSEMIYVPLRWPQKQRAYMDELSRRQNGADGLQIVLEKEPDRAVGWLGNAARMSLYATSAIFAIVNLAIVITFATAVAYSFNPTEAVIHMLER